MEFEAAKQRLDELWNEYVEEAQEQELNVAFRTPDQRVADFFEYMKVVNEYTEYTETPDRQEFRKMRYLLLEVVEGKLDNLVINLVAHEINYKEVEIDEIDGDTFETVTVAT